MLTLSLSMDRCEMIDLQKYWINVAPGHLMLKAGNRSVIIYYVKGVIDDKRSAFSGSNSKKSVTKLGYRASRNRKKFVAA